MGLITKEVEVKLTSNSKHYEQLGYKIPRMVNKYRKLRIPKNSTITVKVEDLLDNSIEKIVVECDGCNTILENVKWRVYKKIVKEDGRYYCHKCAIKLYAHKNSMLTKLKNGKSFEQWCIENNRQDVLNRWDYELNNRSPNEILYSTHKKYYFKCRREIHKSELKNISIFTKAGNNNIKCTACNSFAQWGIDNLGKDFLKKYWDYDKNTVNPWIVPFQYNNKVWIKCQEKEYHGSYDTKPNVFVGKNSRCPYCNKNSGKVHLLDSLGILFSSVLNIWSDKNKKSPYEYAPKASKEVWWKCPEGKHKDYLRDINNSNKLNFRCPDCQFSQGENKISDYFNSRNILFIPQKEFKSLIGVCGGNLSYDFYLSQYNLLIEYQGQFHDGSSGEYSKKNLKRQLEHDRRKRQYAKDHDINLLEIWYWDFDNIETLLEEYLKSLKDVVFIA